MDEATFRRVSSEAFEALAQPVLVLDPDRRVALATGAFCKLVECDSIPEGSDGSKFWPSIAEHKGAVEGEVSSRFQLPSGEAFAVKLAFTPLSDGRLLVTVLAGQPRAAGDTFHSQRLETLGMLSGGIAHDFNNILTGILGHITYLKTILPAVGPHCASLAAIEEGARKGSLMTQQILSFVKLDTTEQSSCLNLSDLVSRTCNLLRGAISPEYNFEYKIPANYFYVMGVEGKMAQVLVNLVINARDAIKPNGSIRVRLLEVENPDSLTGLFSQAEVGDRGFVELQVTDDGHGMPPEVLARVFEPYYTTKKKRGTGLGLSTVDAILRGFGARIGIRSTVGAGTTVSVYLPLVADDKVRPSSGSMRIIPPLRGGSERILVVDDEDPVRNVLGVSLQHLGYRVDIASSGREALDRFQREGGRFDLIIVDMLMPNLSGDELFFKLRAIAPAVRVLLISGFSSEEAVNNVLAHGGLGFIQKPFTIEELARKVRDCLDRILDPAPK